VIGLSPNGVKIWVETQPVDFRRGMNGLVALVASALAADPYFCVDRDYVAEPSRRQPRPAKIWNSPPHNISYLSEGCGIPALLTLSCFFEIGANRAEIVAGFDCF
jgi:hypothetical protein